MSHQVTRARHAAPRAPRTAGRFTRLVAAMLRPVTLTPPPLAAARVLDAVPSMELPAGFMAQRAASVPTERVRVVDPADVCYGVTGIVSEYYGADAPLLLCIPVPQPSGGYRFERRQYGPAQVSPVLDAPDPATAETIVIPAVKVEQSARPEVTVHAEGCRYDGHRGFLVMPDEEGGYEVQFPGAGRPVHFEPSEVEFTVVAP